MALHQSRVEKNQEGIKRSSPQAPLLIEEELFVDRPSVTDIGPKLNRLDQAGLFPCLPPIWLYAEWAPSKPTIRAFLRQSKRPCFFT